MNTLNQSANSVQGFCDNHAISRGMYYKLVKAGIAPKSFKVGSRTLISNEAAKIWRSDMEKRTNDTGG